MTTHVKSRLCEKSLQIILCEFILNFHAVPKAYLLLIEYYITLDTLAHENFQIIDFNLLRTDCVQK